MTSWICSLVFVMYLPTAARAIAVGPYYPTVDTETLDFVDTIIGVYDNGAQVNPGCNTQHNHIQARLIPILVRYPPFTGKAVLLFELVVDLKVVLLQIILVTKDTYIKNVFTLLHFNITTNPGKYRPGEFSVEDVDRINFGDLENDPLCNARFNNLATGGYASVWPDCRSTIAGLHPSYTVTFTCFYHTSTVPLFSHERSTNSPYVFEKTRCGVSIPYAPPGFVGVCDKLLLQCPVLG